MNDRDEERSVQMNEIVKGDLSNGWLKVELNQDQVEGLRQNGGDGDPQDQVQPAEEPALPLPRSQVRTRLTMCLRGSPTQE